MHLTKLLIYYIGVIWNQMILLFDQAYLFIKHLFIKVLLYLLNYDKLAQKNMKLYFNIM